MKKSNLITLLSLCAVIVIAAVYMVLSKEPTASQQPAEYEEMQQTAQEKAPDVPGTTPDVPETTPDVPETTQNVPETTPNTQETKKPDAQETTSTTPKKETNNPSKNKKVSMKDALFIGDSRTVGLKEYATIKGADFFSNVGMSVYNIHKEPVSVAGVGNVSLKELLQKKSYKKIYIMLGVNEVGYNLQSTVNKNKELLAFIQKRQPDAKIIIQANLHVTKSRSDSDKVVNNKAINKLNKALAALADGNRVYYLDANTIFDDKTGNLGADKTGDDTHLYAKYYAEWGNWIVEQTAILIPEE